VNAAALARGARPSDAVALAVIAGLFAVSVAVYETAPAEIVVHYTPPGAVYYGIETLPKAVGLFVVPVATPLTYGVTRLLPQLAGTTDGFGAIAPYYHAGLVALVALLGAVHLLLVLLNVT